MRHAIPTRGWSLALADAIESAKNGDIIEVHTDAMQKLAEQACQRMCPDKNLVFEISDLEEAK